MLGDDAGIRLGGVISNVSVRSMGGALIEDKAIQRMLSVPHEALQSKRGAVGAGLQGDLRERHMFVLRHLKEHIDTR